jgi:hypothetical protein
LILHRPLITGYDVGEELKLSIFRVTGMVQVMKKKYIGCIGEFYVFGQLPLR